MSTSASTGAQQRITGYGVGAPSIKLNPPPIISPNAPNTTNYRYPLGQMWIATTTLASYQLVSNAGNSAIWIAVGGGSSDVSTINSLNPVAGNIVIAGTAAQVAVANAGNTVTLSLTGPYAPVTYTAHGVLIGEGAGSIAATAVGATGTLFAGATGADPAFTASPSVTGNMTAATGFVATTAGAGITLNSGATSGTTTATLNGRSGQVTITTPTINAGATFSFALTNSSISSSTTQVLYGLTGGTTGSAITIQSVTNSANTSTVVVMNGAGATNSTASLVLTFLVIN